MQQADTEKVEDLATRSRVGADRVAGLRRFFVKRPVLDVIHRGLPFHQLVLRAFCINFQLQKWSEFSAVRFGATNCYCWG